ncbi:major tail protein [Stenotrophomonas phage Silvanus]|nr:major tail protein [Stenotrophomonas phage Silvanus]
MSSHFVNGTRFAVARLASLGVAISAVTNAKPPVATTANPPEQGDIVVVTSNWPGLTDVPVRAGVVTANTFELDGYDTTNLGLYPAGEGGGVFRATETFVSLSQVRDVTTEGGDQNYFEYQYVEDQTNRQRRKPTYKSAMGYNIVLDEDSDLPWFNELKEMDRLGEPVVLRETTPKGDVILYVGTVSFNSIPTKTLNENSTVTASFSINSDPIRYKAA